MRFQTLVRLLLVATVIMVFMSACSNSEEGESTAGSESANSEGGYSGESYNWQIGFNTPEESTRGAAANAFKEVVEEQTDGQVTIDIQPGEVLGSEQEMVDQVQSGALDFTLSGGGAVQHIMPAYSTLTLPFIVQDFEEAYAVLDSEIGDRWKEDLEEFGFKVLTHTDLGFAQLTNNERPIEEPSDVQGLQIRSPEEELLITTFQELGASVSTMPFTEVYLALDQGVIDGQFNPIDAIYENNMHEVQDYLALTNHFYYHVNFMMNLNEWDSLEPELQDILMEGATAAQEASREYTQREDEELLEGVENDFEQVTEPNAEAFREEINYSAFNEIIGEEEIQEVQDFIETYRSENE